MKSIKRLTAIALCIVILAAVSVASYAAPHAKALAGLSGRSAQTLAAEQIALCDGTGADCALNGIGCVICPASGTDGFGGGYGRGTGSGCGAAVGTRGGGCR